MASEDPGVGTLAVILELMQRTGNVITGTIKGTISFSLDVIKTGMFFAWRRQMMQSQKGPDLSHGKQSLKELREHEQVGAKIVSVSIGDHEAMKALDKELKRLKIDYAITDDGGKGKHPILRYRNKEDKTYTLHFKINNEQDVMLAQANALLHRYGDPSQEAPDVDEASREDSRQDQNRQQEQEQNQQQEQNQREQQEQARQNQEQEEQARQNQEQEQQTQEQENQQQQQDEQLREQQDDVPGPAQDKGEEREDRADSTGADKAERTASQPLTVAGAAKDVPVDELQQKLGEFKSRSQELTPQQSREPAPGRGASVDELKRHAAQRAQRKNLSRQQIRKQSRERGLGRTVGRSRNRGLELGH